jgi:capsular polysaccharide biosynthesis protein
MFMCETFHYFPIPSRDKIVSAFKTADLPYAPLNKKIFISRDGTGWKNDRILKNKEEIEQLLQKNGYDIIHPEKIPLDVFVNYLQNASRVFITWGSALTNMIFLKPGTKVIILKSKSYSNENIKMFQKIITNYQIDLIEIIDESQLPEENDVMNQIQSHFSKK